MVQLKNRWLSARTKFYVDCQHRDFKEAAQVAQNDWDYQESHELRVRLQKGEMVRVTTTYGKRRTFVLRIVEATLGVKFLCAIDGGHIRASAMWNSDTANDWLSNLRVAEAV